MSYSRRDFLKAAGSGIVLTTVAGETRDQRLPPRLLPRRCPPATEKASFIVNGKPMPPNTKRAPRCGKSSR